MDDTRAMYVQLCNALGVEPLAEGSAFRWEDHWARLIGVVRRLTE